MSMTSYFISTKHAACYLKLSRFPRFLFFVLFIFFREPRDDALEQGINKPKFCFKKEEIYDKVQISDVWLFTELTIADRRNKREIRHLENELPKWQVLVDNVTG